MGKNFCFIITVIFLISSCNESAKNPEKPTEAGQNKDSTNQEKRRVTLCTNCNSANLEIPKEVAEALIANFKDNYLKDASDIATIPVRAWVDACYLSTLLDYIKANPNSQIDGIQFYWGTNKNRTDKVQLFVTPTSKKITPTSKRKPLWPNNIGIPPPCTAQFLNYENNFDDIADPMLKRFNKIHRKDPTIGRPRRDNLSKGVWFSTCVLECISNTIANNQDLRLNGIYIYNAAYKEKMPNLPSQIYPNQSTVVIVFTKLNPQGQIEEDFSIGDELFWGNYKGNKDIKVYEAWKNRNAFNHGELCPDDCPK